MNEVITIGVDLAKNVFQVHGVDAEGVVVVRRRLRRPGQSGHRFRAAACLLVAINGPKGGWQKSEIFQNQLYGPYT